MSTSFGCAHVNVDNIGSAVGQQQATGSKSQRRIQFFLRLQYPLPYELSPEQLIVTISTFPSFPNTFSFKAADCQGIKLGPFDSCYLRIFSVSYSSRPP